MAWQGRMVLVSIGCWLASGCADIPPEYQPTRSLSHDISQPAMPPIVRSQAGDGVKLENPMPAGLPPIFIPPPPPPPPPPQKKEITQTSAMVSRGTVRISIRAWVNGQPIFDEEIRQAAGGAINGVLKLPDSQRAEEMTKLMNNVMERLIDQEVMYQDAVRRLKDASPHALDKLKDFVDMEFNKTLKKMRDGGASETDIRNVEPIARRMMERELVSTEYARTLIKPVAERVRPDDIRDYYEAHKNEFLMVDRVEWQDIFIRLNANLPTPEAAKHFAEGLIHRCRTPEDFNQLMVYNTGVTEKTGGEGLGNLRGQIQPREVEDELFKLRPGEIGPVIAMPTGVHLIRVTKRDYAGQRPLDNNVQKAIRKKLENDIADSEFRSLVRQLRARATIRVERDGP